MYIYINVSLKPEKDFDLLNTSLFKNKLNCFYKPGTTI